MMFGASMEAKLRLWAVLLRNAKAVFAWVAAGSVYAVGDLEMASRRVGRRCVPGVEATHRFRSWSRKLSVSGTAAATAGGDTRGADSKQAVKLQESPRQDRPKLTEGAG